MTPEFLLERVRLLVDDAGIEAQELTDKQYVNFINDGMRLIWDEREDARLAATGQTLTTYVLASDLAITTTLVLPDTFTNALIEYILFRYYDRDSGDTRDKTRAQSHWNRFERLIGTGG